MTDTKKLIEKVVYLDVSLRRRGLFPFVYLWMNYRIPEKVILRRVLAFYLTTIMETAQESKNGSLNHVCSNLFYCRRNKLFREELVFCALIEASEGNRCFTVL